MRQAGLVRSQRGAEGGYWLAKPAKEITVADVIRAVEGPLAAVRGEAPEDVVFSGRAESLGAAVDRGAREPAQRARERDAAPTSPTGKLPARRRQARRRPGGLGQALSDVSALSGVRRRRPSSVTS